MSETPQIYKARDIWDKEKESFNKVMLKYGVKDAWGVVHLFEQKVAEYAGSKYAVSVDNCTDALFLCLKYLKASGKVTIPSKTWISVPCTIKHAGCEVEFEDREWSGAYQLKPYQIYDGAVRMKRGMYKPNTYHCLSFHIRKHIPIGKGGMILLDDKEAYDWFRTVRYEGRTMSDDGVNYMLYKDDPIKSLGWNMYMTPEQAARGLELFENIKDDNPDQESSGTCKDLSKLNIYNVNENNNSDEKLLSLVKQKMSNTKYDEIKFPLTQKTYNTDEIMAMINVLLSDKLTMGKQVELFEKEFADYVGSKYAIFVNSGSSANLLAVSTLSNFKYKNKLNPGDKILVPSVCWSTSVWPLIQNNLIPVFVDITSKTLNMDTNKVEELLENDKKIKGIMAVHILGNSTNMNTLMELKKKYNLVLIEDTCESLGSKYNNQILGTFGECGTYSFYFSHHITTIEGGMVVCNDEEIYKILKCLRSHGWSRGIEENKNKNYIDDRFNFINVGYNLRPMETQAAMGIIQLKKLHEQNENRKYNYNKIKEKIQSLNIDKFSFFEKEYNCNCIWFALPLLLNENIDTKKYLKNLYDNGIDHRPIVTGNFARQPVFSSLNLEQTPELFTNAEIIHKRGFFVGLYSYKMEDKDINEFVDILCKS